MKSVNFQFGMSVVLLFSGSAMAQSLKPVTPGTLAEEIADTANDIFNVFNVNAGDYEYKIVSMDSPLNGDISTTTMVLVGESVGGPAGYEAAFVLTPHDQITSVHGASRSGNGVSLKVLDSSFNSKNIRIKYDPVARALQIL